MLLLVMFILPVAFVLSGCGLFDNNNGNGDSGYNNGGDQNPAPQMFTIQVIGGTGAGSFVQGTNVTIVSNQQPNDFWWWQIDGESTVFSANRSHTFALNRDMTVRSIDITNNFHGKGILGLWNPSGGLVVPAGDTLLFIRQTETGNIQNAELMGTGGRQLTAVSWFNDRRDAQNPFWEQLGFSHWAPQGISVFRAGNHSDVAYFQPVRLFRGIDGRIMARVGGVHAIGGME